MTHRTCAYSFLLVVLSIFLPPIAVLLEVGCGCSLLINVILTLLGIIPGMIHALWVNFCDNDRDCHHH